LEYEKFQITKKAKAQRNVCDAFEVVVVEGEVAYATSLEKNLTLTKEVKHARSILFSLQQ
jgi:metal-responsive CopG/Arc/MetJ family transcriptional regulator